MAFVTRYRGLEVVCDTIDDLDSLAEQLETKRAQRTAAIIQRTHEQSQPSQDTPVPVEQVVRSLNASQRSLVALLSRSYPDSLSDADLRGGLALKSNKALAGVLSGVSKAAKRYGFKGEIIKSSFVRNGKGRDYAYTLNSELLEGINEALK